MYILMDENYIKLNGKLFTKLDDHLYAEFLTWCTEGNTPTLDDPATYTMAKGSVKGKDCYFIKKSPQVLAERRKNTDINKTRLLGYYVTQVCKEVENYLIGTDLKKKVKFGSGKTKFKDILNSLESYDYAALSVLVAGLSDMEEDSIAIKKILKAFEEKLKD